MNAATSATMMSGDLPKVIGGVPTGLFIAGQWRSAASGRTMPVENPATREILAHVADADPADAQAAVAAAAVAQIAWAATAPRTRSDILRRAFELITARAEDLATVMTAEMGKPLAEARGEVAYGVEFLRWFSEEVTRLEGGYGTTPDGRTRMITMRRPVGPCLLITPWNFPLAMGTRKIGPALAADCTVVFKPAPQTPLTALLLAEIFRQAGVPDGVLNVITTSRAAEVIEPIMRGGVLRKLSFTGSTAVGKALLAQASHTVMRTSMELGSNAAFIVFDDADLDTAVDAAFAAKMRNMGEACTAANRIYVQRGGVAVRKDVGRGAHDGCRVVDGAQFGHAFAVALLALGQPGRQLGGGLRGGPGGGRAQRLGAHHDALAVGREGQHVARIGGRRQLAGGVEIVEVDRGAGRQFLHLTLTEPVPGGALVEGAAGGLDRGQPAQPVGMFLLRQVQPAVRGVQVRLPGGPVSQPVHLDLAEDRGQGAAGPGFDPAAGHPARVDDLDPGLPVGAELQVVGEQSAQQRPTVGVQALC